MKILSVEKTGRMADLNHGPLTTVTEEQMHNPFF
jgi:hypothetical protein